MTLLDWLLVLGWLVALLLTHRPASVFNIAVLVVVIAAVRIAKGERL